MSEASRSRRLFLENRLEELACKHGPLQEEPLPDWLDNREAFEALHAVVEASKEEVVEARRPLSVSEALRQLDHYGETPLYACPVCGEESAKANVRLGAWHCTACDTWGTVQRRSKRTKRRGSDW